MADLSIDLGQLQETADELGMLVEEFDRAEDIAGDAAGSVGSSRVADALHEFASNWRVHRQDLVESMQSVYKMAYRSHDTFVDVDSRLARDIRDACRPDAGGTR